ncbi:sensor histidine kinase [Rhodococcoides kyotonense]|uniref:sensor histidine kinase n=1 Tax=Rhodococcoides kyotonense TaxID=398843 RepID=UPI0020B8DBEB|nr:ATP-binding protein [Rhodococcus kyotonensis]
MIAVEVTVVLQLKQIAPENSFGAVFMFGVLIVSAGWGFRISIATSVASAAAYAYIHASEDSISLVPAVLVFTVLALVTNVLVGQSRLRAVESEQRRQEADLLARLARSMLMTSDIRKMLDDAGERLTSELDLPRPHTCIVLGPAPSLDADREAIALTDGPTVIGALLVPRGLQAADTRRVRRIVPALESLLTAALQAQETRHELTRSRARVVAASDHARRTIERDLHDGAQQHIVSLGLQLRSVQAAVPEQLPELRQRVDGSIETLTRIHEDLRELSRGIHPAILTRGGLAHALKTLARRSSIPVSLNTDIPARLPDAIEVAAYYVVAEALTNAAKYSGATEVTISAESTTAVFDLIVSDDGCGGADFTSGSGLIGLRDRVAAVGGTLTLRSTPDSGTTLTVRIAGRPPSPPRGRAEGHDGFARVRGEGQ